MKVCSDKCPLDDCCEGACFHPEMRIDVPGEIGINAPEPPPIKNNRPAVWDLVLADMKERDEIGKQKYDTRLQPFNGRDPLVDAYQEALDLVVYLRQAIYERDNPGVKL